MKYTWSGQNLVIIAVTSFELLAFLYFRSVLFGSVKYTPVQKKMESIYFLFLGHCGF